MSILSPRLAVHSTGFVLSEEIAKINPRWKLYFNRAETDQILIASKVYSAIPENNWSLSIARNRPLRIFTSLQQSRTDGSTEKNIIIDPLFHFQH